MDSTVFFSPPCFNSLVVCFVFFFLGGGLFSWLWVFFIVVAVVVLGFCLVF